MLSYHLQRSPSDALALLQKGKGAADVADALEIPTGQLLYLLYRRSPSTRYKSFQLQKKSGGYRQILAPTKGIRILQQKFLRILEEAYSPPPWVHGFAKAKSIVTNASGHCKKRFVVNIDLESFYDSINFGRVRGALMGKPFLFAPSVASVLSQLTTFDNKLPQGAPTSPILSNIVAWSLDRRLLALARKYHLTYSRYADDLTFSTTKRSLSRNVIRWDGSNPVTGDREVGRELREVIEGAGSRLTKRRFAFRFRRRDKKSPD